MRVKPLTLLTCARFASQDYLFSDPPAISEAMSKSYMGEIIFLNL